MRVSNLKSMLDKTKRTLEARQDLTSSIRRGRESVSERKSQQCTKKQATSAKTCSEVCLQEVSAKVKCLYPAAPSSSIKAEYHWADFNRSQRSRCACTARARRNRDAHGTCTSWCYLFDHGLPLHLTGHMGLQYDAAKLSPGQMKIILKVVLGRIPVQTEYRWGFFGDTKF